MPCVEPIYGFADWAAGYTDGEPVEEIQSEVQGEAQGEAQGEVASAAYESSYMQKAAMFAVIIGCVALYMRISKRRNGRPEDLGYEKTMA